MTVAIKKKSAFKGRHLPENKLTAASATEKFPLPEKVLIPLNQNIGAPCTPLVKRGEEVKTGQKIAESDAFVSVPLHSPVSGKVSKLVKYVSPVNSRIIDALEITSDGKDEWVELNRLPGIDDTDSLSQVLSAIDKLPRDEVIKRVRESGAVGLGGATFPTHIKLSPPPDKKIDTLILNGCECEPFITSDHRTLVENGREVLLGLYIIYKLLNPREVYIGIEDNKPDAIDNMVKLIGEMGFADKFTVVSLESKYPMGAEKTLIKTILGREVPIGGLPMDVGVVVSNVTTAKVVWEGVVEGRPLIERLVTVTGAVKEPKNLLVRMGVPIQSLIDYCGGPIGKANEIVTGGPMMGVAIADPTYPVTKAVNCILVRESRPAEEGNCINCGRCVQACPMNLMPLMFVRNVKAGRYEACEDYFIADCIECGTCAYACPANIAAVQYVKTAKSVLAKKGKK